MRRHIPALLAGFVAPVLAITACTAVAVRNVPSSGAAPAAVASSSDPGEVAVSHTGSTRCGIERWGVKTGTDPFANQVNLTPRPSTISQLAALPAPVNPGDKRQSGEFATATIHATLTAYKSEADSDYHLALRDSTGATMIAEIPSPGCVGGSAWERQIDGARKTFDSSFAASSTYVSVSRPVTVTGVIFYDKIHGQRGVAPNGVELHPVLNLVIG